MTIALPSLRDYQLQLHQAVRESLKTNSRLIANMPTGGGKTRLAKFLFGCYYNRQPDAKQSGHALLAVHRRGLVDNLSDSLNEDPQLPHGMIMSNRDTDWSHPVQVGSIDTLLSWHVDETGYTADTTFDLICYDECHSHHQKFQKWLMAHDVKRASLGLRRAFVCSLSATPYAKGLASVYSTIVQGPSVQWLTDHGHLVPFRYFQAKHLAKLDLLVEQGDTGYTDSSLEKAFDGLAGELVPDWFNFAEGRPTVGFFSRLSHAREARDAFLAAGVNAEYVDGTMADKKRRRLFNQLRNGEITYLANVGIVDRGTDIPVISCLQLCTAIRSVVRLIQILGRGARPSPGKEDCLVIDHGGSICRLNTFFADPIEWVLKAETEKELGASSKPIMSCPSCGRQYRGGYCSACGHESTPKERASVGLEFVGGELVELKPPEKERTTTKTCERMLISALYKAAACNQNWRQALRYAHIEAESQGTKFIVPSSFKIGDQTFFTPAHNSIDYGRKVADLFAGRFVRRNKVNS